MASGIYNNALYFEARGAINYLSDTFYAMLVTSSYTPNLDTHDFRDDVTNEVTGTGYTSGGAATTVTVAKDTSTNPDRTSISFSAVTWTTATITARAAVIYKRRGGASSADELVAYIDFGSDKTSTAGDFVLTFSTPIYKTPV